MKRLGVLCLVGGTIVTYLLLAAPLASAHHYVGTCGEVGEFSESASARLGGYNSTMGVLAYVGYVPPARDCVESGVYRPNYGSTQHTSLHAKRFVDRREYCLETVGQRFTSGLLRIYGYNCGVNHPGDPVPAPNIHDIPNYGSPWMYFFMSSGGSYDWHHYYYRYDTNQWMYMGFTPSFCCRYYNSWLESTGYNETAPRATLFRGFTETRSDGSYGTSNFPCPTSRDDDRHQEQRPNAGGLAENTDWFPEAANVC